MAQIDFKYYDSTSDTPAITGLNFGTNADRLCVLAAMINNTVTINSLTIDSASMLPAAAGPTSAPGGSASWAVSGYTLAPSNTGALNIAGNMTPIGQMKSLLAASFDGIASVRSATVVGSAGSASQPSATVTTVAGDIVVLLGNDLAVYDPTITGTSGSTVISGSGYFIGLMKTASGTSTTVSGTFSGGARNWQGVVFVLVPTGGGGGGGAPVITGPSGGAGATTSSKTVAENSTAVHTFTADVAVTWSLNGGADAAAFAINPSTGALTFAAAPSYETPTDLGDTAGNNTYVVVVRATATSGGATADQTVTVTVSNVAEPPLAPTIGVATAGDRTVSIAFTAPVNTGKPSITGYTATLSPGGITKAGASSPIVFGAGDGIVNGTAYTGTVTATNSEGTGPASAASNSVTPNAVPSGPTINTQPTTQTAKIGAAATWTLAATSSGGTLVRQWKFNGGNVGSNSNSYTRTGIVLGDHGATVLCNVADDNGNLNTNSVSLVVAVTLVNTVPAQSGTEGDSFSLNLANYFAGGLSRTYALHSGTLPTGCSLGGSTVSGTLGSNGSGSFVIRATDANGNIEDTGTIPWTINAPGVGASFTTPPLEDNTTGVWANEPVDFIAAFDRDTLQLVALILGGTTNSDGQVTGTHGNLTPGTLYRWGYRLANGATNLPDLGAF